MKRLLYVALLCGAALAEAPSTIALRDARVVTVSGPTLPRATVLIREGLIEAVGESVTIPAGAWIVEAKGLTVYPGLIDALMPAEAPAPATPAAPSRSSRAAPATGTSAPAPARGPEDRPATTSWVRAADVFNAGDRRLQDERNAGFTSVALFPTGGIVAGQGALVNTAGEKRRMVVASPLGQYLTLATRGYGSFPNSLMGVFAYIRQLYLDTGHYTLQKAAYERHAPGVARPDYDRAVEGLLESPRALLPARSVVELDRMAHFAAELKLNAVLYGGEGAYAAAAGLAARKLPVLVSLKWPERARDANPDERESVRLLEHREKAPGGPAALAKAGARFAFYTDGVAGRDVPRAMRRALDAGLRREDAVRACTLAPAEIYGLADRLGSIEKGKIANLVVTDGELFGEKTRVKYVFVDGAKFEPPPPETRPSEAPRSGGVQ